MEDDLLSNKFPYPKHYNGNSWNTITTNTRKSIPSYLQSTLPNMKYQKVKEKFQEMNKFCPPEITYFEKMINSSKSGRKRSVRSHREGQSGRKKRENEVERLREELQYALIMTNRDSKILVDIVEKVSKAEKRLKQRTPKIGECASFEEKLVKTKRAQSRELGKQTQECFRNTIDIVFSVKKKEYIKKIRQNP